MKEHEQHFIFWVLCLLSMNLGAQTVTPLAQRYIACEGKSITVGVVAQAGYTYQWFDSPTATSVLSSNSTCTITKNASNVQYVYVQPITSGSPIGSRVPISIYLSTICNSSTDQSCAGQVLFEQDFGGNSPSDPLFSPTDFVNGTSDLIFSNTSTSSGHYALTKYTTYPAFVIPNYDHTFLGDQTRGYFMYIDPAPNQMNAVLYAMQISNLCDSASLNFTMWATDLQRNYAIPIFELQLVNAANNQILVQSGLNTPPRHNPLTWYQYGFDFSLPAGVHNIIFKIINKNIDNVGNDWAIDDIAIKYCGANLDLIAPESTDTTICAGTNLNFNGLLSSIDSHIDSNMVQYQWQFSTTNSASGTWQNIAGATSPHFTLSNAALSNSGYYRLNAAEPGLLNSYCSFYTNSVHVSVIQCNNLYADATLQLIDSAQITCDSMKISIDIGNIGDIPLNAPYGITIYKDQYRGQVIYTTHITDTLLAGANEIYDISIPSTNFEAFMPINQLVITVNNVGAGIAQHGGGQQEYDTTNNTIYIPFSILPYQFEYNAVTCIGNAYSDSYFDIPIDSLTIGEKDYHRTINTGSMLGCDSLITLHLSVGQTDIINFQDTTCRGKAYHQHGFNISATQTDTNEILEFHHQETNMFGCDSIVTLTLVPLNGYIHITSSTTDFCDEYSAILSAETNSNHLLWNTGDTISEITISVPGTYSAVATIGQCSYADQISIAPCDFQLYLPNAITPSNQDNVNDYFFIPEKITHNIAEFQISIFNRWGELVFTSNDKNFKWDASNGLQAIHSNIYTYVIKLISVSGRHFVYRGSITVL